MKPPGINDNDSLYFSFHNIHLGTLQQYAIITSVCTNYIATLTEMLTKQIILS